MQCYPANVATMQRCYLATNFVGGGVTALTGAVLATP